MFIRTCLKDTRLCYILKSTACIGKPVQKKRDWSKTCDLSPSYLKVRKALNKNDRNLRKIVRKKAAKGKKLIQ